MRRRNHPRRGQNPALRDKTCIRCEVVRASMRGALLSQEEELFVLVSGSRTSTDSFVPSIIKLVLVQHNPNVS